MANEQVLTAVDACECEPANVLINYVLSKNCRVIVKSENATRMESNMKFVCAWEFETLDFLTTAEELENRRLREEATKNQYI